MEPPCDPEGNPTMVSDLLITMDKCMDLLEAGLSTVLTWINTEKQLYE